MPGTIEEKKDDAKKHAALTFLDCLMCRSIEIIKIRPHKDKSDFLLWALYQEVPRFNNCLKGLVKKFDHAYIQQLRFINYLCNKKIPCIDGLLVEKTQSIIPTFHTNYIFVGTNSTSTEQTTIPELPNQIYADDIVKTIEGNIINLRSAFTQINSEADLLFKQKYYDLIAANLELTSEEFTRLLSTKSIFALDALFKIQNLVRSVSSKDLRKIAKYLSNIVQQKHFSQTHNKVLIYLMNLQERNIIVELICVTLDLDSVEQIMNKVLTLTNDELNTIVNTIHLTFLQLEALNLIHQKGVTLNDLHTIVNKLMTWKQFDLIHKDLLVFFISKSNSQDDICSLVDLIHRLHMPKLQTIDLLRIKGIALCDLIKIAYELNTWEQFYLMHQNLLVSLISKNTSLDTIKQLMEHLRDLTLPQLQIIDSLHQKRVTLNDVIIIAKQLKNCNFDDFHRDALVSLLSEISSRINDPKTKENLIGKLLKKITLSKEPLKTLDALKNSPFEQILFQLMQADEKKSSVIIDEKSSTPNRLSWDEANNILADLHRQPATQDQLIALGFNEHGADALVELQKQLDFDQWSFIGDYLFQHPDTFNLYHKLVLLRLLSVRQLTPLQAIQELGRLESDQALLVASGLTRHHQ